jgi:cbb3-type cytochrome c oxidase subunit III
VHKARVFNVAVALVALATAVLLASGCGTGGLASSRGDVQNGGKLFQSKCGGCHTLAAAGTQGTIGPDLDGAFYGDRSQGFKQDTIVNVVLDQIRLSSAPMPQNLVKGQDAEDVAAYVASVAGVNGPNPKSASTTSTDGKTIFKANCGSCHTLKAAGAAGTVGPNLDQLKPAEAIVKTQVEHGGGVMPAFKGKLTDKQIDAVAKFVASSAGK